MDSNGCQFKLFASAQDFQSDNYEGCLWDEQSQSFHLAENQEPRFAKVSSEQGLEQWKNAMPLVQDEYGQLGFLSPDAKQLNYSLQWPIQEFGVVKANKEDTVAQTLEELLLDDVDAPEGNHFKDLHLGGDGRVALLYSNEVDHHGLLMVHLGRRWQRSCGLLDQPKRVWVDHLSRTWVAGDNWLTLCSGEPLPQAYHPQSDRFEPLQTNPNPLHSHWRQNLPVGHELLAICADQKRLYLLLFHRVDKQQKIVVRSLSDDSSAELTILPLSGIEGLDTFIIDIAPMGAGRLCLMVPKAAKESRGLDLPVIDLSESGDLVLLARRYPQHSQQAPRFVTGQEETAIYLSDAGPKKVYSLSQARFRSTGRCSLSRVLDSGEVDTLWHRLYFDGCIPPGCSLTLKVRSYSEKKNPSGEWQRQPKPHWQPLESELPFYQSVFKSKSSTQGLFEILLQSESGSVREIRGRYLALQIEMNGDGRHSPALAAMRVYYRRFSWQHAYLPEHFHQQQGPDSSPSEMANGADVRERFLACFEGMMTPIEGRIAHSECWLSPLSIPAQGLPALAKTIGVDLPEHWPIERQRRWVEVQGELRHRRGTYAGLCLALDVATDGAVGLGQIVPVENYRLRRTLATILGLDFSDENHPLTLGTGQSGNSIVGESLILTADESKEFLALFAPNVGEKHALEESHEEKIVENFFDEYAHKLSILVHHKARSLKEGIQAILEDWVPAHLQWKLIETDHPFVLGLSPLLGIDTYLEVQPPWRQVVLNDTYLGREGIMRNPIALSPTDANSLFN